MAKFLLLFKLGSGVWYKTTICLGDKTMKTKTRWSYIWHFVPWVFSMCVGASTELLALHTWDQFSDHKIFLLFQGETKINLAEIFKTLWIFPSGFPAVLCFRWVGFWDVPICFDWQRLHMELWSMFASWKGELQSWGWDLPQTRNPSHVVEFSLQARWQESRDGWSIVMKKLVSSILALLKRADGYWPSSKWNMWVFFLPFFLLTPP